MVEYPLESVLRKEGVVVAAEECRPFFDRLQILYGDMDQAYRKTAACYGFECQGCDDNCCLTRFYHHTYIEYLYLYNAFVHLEDTLQRQIRTRAREIEVQALSAEKQDGPVHLMCPLNSNGLCRLYEYRPMICRLHGIAYEINFPSRGVMRGDGCRAFEKAAGHLPYSTFDRTPFYNKMAGLERDFKQALGLNRKIKKTIAN